MRMWGVKQTRTLLADADPARLAVSPAPVPAEELIARAEAVAPARVARWWHRRAPRRRLLLAGGATALAAVAALVVADPTPQAIPELAARPPVVLPLVVVPIASSEDVEPESAAEHLRRLAAEIVDAPHDGETGEYSYHLRRSWGEWGQGSEDGHYMGYVADIETWAAADGSGVQRELVLGAQFPDEESPRYYEAAPNPDLLDFPQENVNVFDPGTLHLDLVPPFDRTAVREHFNLVEGGEPSLSGVKAIYDEWVVPREARATVLEVVAEVPGVMWLAEVTDRAGRPGVAVSHEDSVGRTVLVFDPSTGEPLSIEYVDLLLGYLHSYNLYLDSGWVGEVGAVPRR